MKCLTLALLCLCGSAYADTPTMTPSRTPTATYTPVNPTPIPTVFYVVGSANLSEAFYQPGFDTEGLSIQFAYTPDGQTCFGMVDGSTPEARERLFKQVSATTKADWNKAHADWGGWFGKEEYWQTIVDWAEELKEPEKKKSAEKGRDKVKEAKK